MTNMNQPAKTPDTGDKNVKMNAKIKEAWSKLSEDDIKLYDANRAQFFAKVQEKQNVSKVDAEKRLAEIEKACGCGSAPEKDASKKVA